MVNLPKLTKAEEDMLILLADNRMSVTAVAKESYYSRKAVYDRLRGIKSRTGIDPLDFWGLHRLLSMIEIGNEEQNDARRID